MRQRNYSKSRSMAQRPSGREGEGATAGYPVATPGPAHQGALSQRGRGGAAGSSEGQAVQKDDASGWHHQPYAELLENVNDAQSRAQDFQKPRFRLSCTKGPMPRPPGSPLRLSLIGPDDQRTIFAVARSGASWWRVVRLVTRRTTTAAAGPARWQKAAGTGASDRLLCRCREQLGAEKRWGALSWVSGPPGKSWRGLSFSAIALTRILQDVCACPLSPVFHSAGYASALGLPLGQTCQPGPGVNCRGHFPADLRRAWYNLVSWHESGQRQPPGVGPWLLGVAPKVSPLRAAPGRFERRGSRPGEYRTCHRGRGQPCTIRWAWPRG